MLTAQVLQYHARKLREVLMQHGVDLLFNMALGTCTFIYSWMIKTDWCIVRQWSIYFYHLTLLMKIKNIICNEKNQND